jgi:hypothetical protein
VNKSITDRSPYGLAAGAMMLLAAAGLGELQESTALPEVPTIDSREIDLHDEAGQRAGSVAQQSAAESMPTDPEYPDARALVLAVAALLARQ